MAKCIKNIKTKKIRRVSDKDASKLVIGGQWKYCPKSEYKLQKTADK
jgi:hypothetical protein